MWVPYLYILLCGVENCRRRGLASFGAPNHEMESRFEQYSSAAVTTEMDCMVLELLKGGQLWLMRQYPLHAT